MKFDITKLFRQSGLERIAQTQANELQRLALENSRMKEEIQNLKFEKSMLQSTMKKSPSDSILRMLIKVTQRADDNNGWFIGDVSLAATKIGRELDAKLRKVKGIR